MCFANAVALIVVVTRIVVNVYALSIFFIIITSLIVFSSENLVLFFAVFLLTLCHFHLIDQLISDDAKGRIVATAQCSCLVEI